MMRSSSFLPDDIAERLILECAGLAWTYSVIHPDGTRDLWVSEEFTRMTGYAADSPLRSHLDLMTGPRTDEGKVKSLKCLRAEGRPGTADIVLYRADGSAFWDRMVVAPIEGTPEPTWITLHSDVTTEKQRETEHVELVARMVRARRRTTILTEIFDELVRITDSTKTFECVTDQLVPTLADWAGVLQNAARGDSFSVIASAGGWPEPGEPTDFRATGAETRDFVRAVLDGRDSLYVPWVTQQWIDSVIPADDIPFAPLLVGASLIVVPIRGVDSHFGSLALVVQRGHQYTREDFEMAQVLGTRLGLVTDNLLRSESDRTRMETIEAAVFAPPTDLPGFDIAADSLPPVPPGTSCSWCDAYPLPGGGAAFALSHLFAADMSAVATAAAHRAAVKAMLYKDPCAAAALRAISELAYVITDDPLPSSGQIATLVPHGSGYLLKAASVAHAPIIVREPGKGFRAIEDELVGSLGANAVPMTVLQEELAPGSVLFFMSDTVFDNGLASSLRGMGLPVEDWEKLPEDAPAIDYANVVRERNERIRWKQQSCFIIVRTPPSVG